MSERDENKYMKKKWDNKLWQMFPNDDLLVKKQKWQNENYIILSGFIKTLPFFHFCRFLLLSSGGFQ